MATLTGMIRRIVAVALWAYFAWYLAALIALSFDGPEIAGPIAAALVVVLDIVGGLRASRARRPASRAAVAEPST